MTTFSRMLGRRPAGQRAGPMGVQQATVTCLQSTNPETAPNPLFSAPRLTDPSPLYQNARPELPLCEGGSTIMVDLTHVNISQVQPFQ